MKITRSQLKRIIQEELQEDSRFMDPDAPEGHTPFPPQKKAKTSDGLDSVVNDFSPAPIQEKAPPGKKDMVKALKKKMCGGKDDCPEAFATAWNRHNKEK